MTNYRKILCIVSVVGLLAWPALAQPLPGTAPLQMEGDPAQKMVEGISAYLLRETEASVAHRAPSRERLRKILGVVDQRVQYSAPELVATTTEPALLADDGTFRAFAVRWPVLDGVTAEGLLFEPAGASVARVVALPDADQIPERFRAARLLAAAGCEVLVPVLIDRNDTWSGNPKIRMTNQPHREFIYRMAFPVGRHILGYEVQKVLGAVDWFAKAPKRLPIGVWGYGEGGAIALYAAALDDRIDAAVVSGYFQSRQGLWKEPLYRNVWGLLKDFGDAELAGLVAPRTLIIEAAPGPEVSGPPAPDAKGRGAAPGTLLSPPRESVEREFVRAEALYGGSRLHLTDNAISPFLEAIGAVPGKAPVAIEVPVRNAEAREHREFQQLVDYTQKLVRESGAVREALWSKADASSPEKWAETSQPLRARFWDEVLGRLPGPTIPLHPSTRKSYSGEKWNGYEVTLDVFPDVFAYGVLLVPKDIRPGENRPVLVGQHGLEGRPQHLFGQPEVDRQDNTFTNFHYYQNIGSRFADLGYVVYLPQNPYIGDFRKINRLANPLGLSMFSFILSQNERMLDWLGSLPYVDSKRIGFYGLSYGGKTAVRIPPLLGRYAVSVCSGDFNEWIVKLTTVDAPYTYMFTDEYEVVEFDLAHVANHAEMAMMMAPRYFMVERGHRDGVGVDEWVSYEYGKVRRFYDEMGIGDRTRIEYFNGPHMIHGRGTVDFVRAVLDR
jgi:dienelactone hydrolase